MATTRTISSGSTSGGLGTALAQFSVAFTKDGNRISEDLPPLYFDGSPCIDRLVDLTSGNNTITCHAATRAVCVLPPTGSSVTLKYKASGDTSFAENAYGWHFLTAAAALGTTLVINASGDLTGVRILEL